MDKKATGIVAYITLIGWLIAFFAGDKEGAKFHLNQALVLWISNIVLSVVALLPIPFIGIVVSLANIFVLVCWIMGLVYAIQGNEKEVPLLGQIKILK